MIFFPLCVRVLINLVNLARDSLSSCGIVDSIIFVFNAKSLKNNCIKFLFKYDQNNTYMWERLREDVKTKLSDTSAHGFNPYQKTFFSEGKDEE